MDIFTICTENYKDAIEFSIPSWLKNSTGKIYIYTDFDYKYPDDRVTILNEFEKTDDWLEIVRLKAKMLNKFIRSIPTAYFAFIDIDCYMVEDVSEVFNNDFDLAVTRIGVKGRDANSGVFFCRDSERMLRFSKEWMGLQDRYKNYGIGMIKHRTSSEQMSFSAILHREFNNSTYLHVLSLPGDIYNNEADLIDDWLKKVSKGKILHFKGRRWRDKELVDKIIKQ